MTETAHHRKDLTHRGWGFPRIVAAAGGAFLLAFGVWAMADPRSFFDAVATFEPYNRHFLLDIGAFQIGLGAVLVLAAARPHADTLAVALLGVGIGAAAHVLSHAVTSDLGGTPESDIPFFTVFTLLVVSAGVLRWRDATA